MHPYDAKSNFFLEMDVLCGPQNNRPGDAAFHATLDFACTGARVGATAAGGFVSTECSLLLLHAYNVGVCVFLAFTATFISYAFLPMLFHAPPCRLLDCASGA